ncbi:SDR family NAD(P)-dependent oxidoreductase [Neptunicella sp.]|uniref:SDR family NAD(P)-dependent oxidoreductase n=1 Tax=Neptunicella sp. TaxID=2125986 RepID=UPI003F68DB52
MSENAISDTQYPSLKSRHVFITGGATGIGAALVARFCQQQARVSFIDIDKRAGEAQCQQLLAERQFELQFIHCDIRDVDQLLNSIEQANEAFGDISVLINNAADDTRHDTETLSVEYWDERMAVNLRPCFFAAQAVVPQMKRSGGGSIINMGSISWRVKQDFMPAYTTAKAAIEGLTRTLARHHGQDEIRVNTLIPGWVMTDKQLSCWLDADNMKNIHNNQCLKQTLQPNDIANTALFLAADDSRMLTAQSIIVDGGWV